MTMADDGGVQAGMMTLQGPDGSFDLAIVQYQFPMRQELDLDANWLIIGGRVTLQGREWRFQDPCLTTFEVVRLANWLEASALGQASGRGCGFTEPNLDFHGPSNGAIRVSFALESAPPWARRGDDWDKHGFDVPVGPALTIAAAQLRHALAVFPVRGTMED
ncbi:MAG: hypothetical protein V4610_19270 [Pseudomonadota bacterium]|jgi:hypothetical protein